MNMDYERYLGKLQDIKNALEEGHKNKLKKEEELFQDNIGFIDELMHDITYKQITEESVEFIQNFLQRKIDTSVYVAQPNINGNNSCNKNNEIKLNNKSANTVTNETDMIKREKQLTDVSPSQEDVVIQEFMDKYNHNKLPDDYKILSVTDSFATELSRINRKGWDAYPDKAEITLSEGSNAMYYAYSIKENPNSYFLVLAKQFRSQFGGIRVIQNAYLTFFEFDIDVCLTVPKPAKLVKPAIVKLVDGKYQLAGKAWKGKIEF